MMIGAVQIFKILQQNCFIFAKISARGNRGSAIFKTPQQNALFLRKSQLLIIGEVQIFKSHQQNCFIFAKIAARDNRGRSNF